MKVLELLDELEEIVDTSGSFPLTGKILVDADDILSVVADIRRVLPEEITKAQQITNDQDRILAKAKQEYQDILSEAKREAEKLIETDDITVKARRRADEIVRTANDNARDLKLSTFEYIDGLLYDFQNKMDSLKETYFETMYAQVNETLENANVTVQNNRNEIRDMLYKTQDESY